MSRKKKDRMCLTYAFDLVAELQRRCGPVPDVFDPMGLALPWCDETNGSVILVKLNGDPAGQIPEDHAAQIFEAYGRVLAGLILRPRLAARQELEDRLAAGGGDHD